MSKKIRLVPRYTAESNPPPPPPPAGAMTHVQIAKTEFGGDWGDSLEDFYYGPPLFRAVKQMSGSPTAIMSRNPNGIHMPYCLFWSAVSDTPNNSDYNSFWVQLAEQFAVDNGYDPEDLFIHASSTQHTLSSAIDHIDADGTVHLGLINGHFYRTTLMNTGDEYVIQNNSNANFNGLCTILAIIDSHTFVIDKSSSGSGSGGSIFKFGDGTKTKANRFQFFLWDNWRYTLNPGTEAAKQWAIFKVAQSMGAQSRGVFFDEFDSTDVKGVSLEYPTDTAYEADMTTLLGQLKAAYPGKLIEVNTASFTKTADFNFAVAAGSNQLEQLSNVIEAYSLDSIFDWISSLIAAGVYVEMSMVPEWKDNVAGAQLFIPSAYRTAGGHHYGTPDARAFVLSYAAYMQMVDSDVNSYGNYHLFWGCLPGKIETVDKLSKWFAIVEHNIGRAMGPAFVLAQGNLAEDGGSVKIYARRFSIDGTNPYCLMLHSRTRFGDVKKYDSNTSFNVPIESAPVGTDWWLLDENNQFAFQVSGTLSLWCAEAAFLIAVPR